MTRQLSSLFGPARVVAGATLFCLHAAALAQPPTSNQGIYLYQGSDRAQRLVEQAKKEGQVLLYSTMTVNDGKALAAEFERKYGVRVVHWRSSAEKIVNRVVGEARARRHEADVVETSAHRMEALHREGLLADFHSPVLRELVPAAFPRGHRQHVADRFSFFVMGYNTNLVKPEELPRTYEDLLQPRWAGKITIEGTDVAWFAAVTQAMGEKKGLAYFHKLAATKPQIRNSHILTAQLVASGEVPFFLTAYNNNMETLKRKGAPVEWAPLQPAFGQSASIGVLRDAPHPHAALLFTEFVLSKDGQEILKAANRVPSSTLVDSPLNKFPYQIIDPVLAMDENAKWAKLFSNLFLGGEPVKEED
ncbi:MAG TPA: extracellular solute-binding protein [Myxococcaceae bacterium]|nr:extracellular solute-binding protein [Myxococcaceae bacterium]